MPQPTPPTASIPRDTESPGSLYMPIPINARDSKLAWAPGTPATRTEGPALLTPTFPQGIAPSQAAPSGASPFRAISGHHPGQNGNPACGGPPTPLTASGRWGRVTLLCSLKSWGQGREPGTGLGELQPRLFLLLSQTQESQEKAAGCVCPSDRPPQGTTCPQGCRDPDAAPKITGPCGLTEGSAPSSFTLSPPHSHLTSKKCLKHL